MESPIKMDDLGVPLFSETQPPSTRTKAAAAAAAEAVPAATAWASGYLQQDLYGWRNELGAFLEPQN